MLVPAPPGQALFSIPPPFQLGGKPLTTTVTLKVWVGSLLLTKKGPLPGVPQVTVLPDIEALKVAPFRLVRLGGVTLTMGVAVVK